MADSILKNMDYIIEQNNIDLQNGKNSGLGEHMIDRLMLNESRIKSMANSFFDISKLQDPIGRTLWETKRPNGLTIKRISVPMGVIGVIFEARPNVTADSAALCLKAGSAVILRGGKEAINSNTAIVNIIRKAISDIGLNEDCVALVSDTSRQSAEALMKLRGYVDLLIPRGGHGLIQSVLNNSTVPVLQTGEGVCHIYVDKMANIEMACKIIENAKVSRPSVCNAVECILVHKDIANIALPKIAETLLKNNVEIRGDEAVCNIVPQAIKAKVSDFGVEFLSLKIAIKVVDNIEEAILHIQKYSTGHSESIITSDENAAKLFLTTVDSSAVYHNASTRFTDGGEFGFGAEIGISTQKLHARGPVGLNEITTYKYIIYGEGQVR